MNTSVKYESDTKVKIVVKLDVDDIAISEAKALRSLVAQTKVAGFRKGKAPLAAVKKAVDPKLMQDKVIDYAINQAVSDAFTANNLRPIDRPSVSLSKFVPGESMEITIDCDILPPIKLGNYKALKIPEQKISVSAEEVNEILERIQKSLATKKTVERSAKLGDEVVIDFSGKKDGVKFAGGESKDFPLTLGSNQFIPGFEEAIVGHKTAESFDIPLTFPKDYSAKDLAGQEVVFTVTIKSVNEIALHKLDDELAKQAGPFNTIEELKKDIKAELTAQKQRQNDEDTKQDLVGQLVSTSKIAAPDVLISDQLNQLQADFEGNLKYRGMSIEQYLEDKKFKSKEDWLQKEVKPIAENRVKSGLVLAELVSAEAITVLDSEIEARLESLHKQYSKSPEMVKQLDHPSTKQDIASAILNEKALDRLVELNKKK